MVSSVIPNPLFTPIPLTAIPVGQLLFSPSNFLFWSACIYSVIVFPKISPKTGWASLSFQSWNEFFQLCVALKILANRTDLIPNAGNYLEILSGKAIPTLIQNIVNCVPTLNKFDGRTFNWHGAELTIDPGNALLTWATNIVNSTSFNPSNILNFQRLWSDPTLYKGAVANYSTSGSSWSVADVSVSVSVLTGGTYSIIELANVIPTPLTGIYVIGTMFNNPQGLLNDVEYDVKCIAATNLTPQLLLTALLLGSRVLNFSSLITSLRIGITGSQFVLGDSKFVRIQSEYTANLPNPQIVDPEENEEQNSSQSSSTGKVKLSLTKVRRSKEKKVTLCKVSVSDLKTSKKISSEEVSKVETLLGVAYLNLEKASNVLQLDSNYIIKVVSEAWSKAKESVDPSAGSTS